MVSCAIQHDHLMLIVVPMEAVISKLKGELGRFWSKLLFEFKFFFKNWGKSRFMIAMSKKAQVLGIEKLFLKSKKAFFYFFMFYLIRDTILYIIIPIYFADYFK